MSNDRFKFRVWYPKTEWNNRLIMDYHDIEIGETYVQKGDECVFMMSTGLKDKHGRLIYEGDVIKTETGAQIVVDWDPTKAGFIPWAWAYDDYCDPSTIEIVKNVYENPELIEDK